LFDEKNIAEISDPAFPGERLVVCRNPLLAAERARKRKELLDATEKELEKIVNAVNREKRPLKGTDKIALCAGKVTIKYKMEKGAMDFYKISRPTTLQQKILNLLGTKLDCSR